MPPIPPADAAMDLEPPRDLAPRQFFEEWLPGAVRRAFGGARRWGEVRVRVRLDGDDGGAWDLRVHDGALLVGATGQDEQPVTVRQTVRDWRATLFAEDGAVALRPPRASALDILFVDPQLRALIDELRGTVRLEVTEYNDRTWSMEVKFGEQEPTATPDAVVSMTADTYARLKDKTLLPPQAYFGGLIRITGNTGLAMQMAMAILPRFTG